MEQLGIAPFDIAVIAILVLCALFGLVTGFVRGGLFVLSWAGAAIVTLYGFASVRPLARQYIEPAWLADLIGGAVLFIVALIVLHLVSHILSGWVRSSSLNALDRSLGLLAGGALGAVIISVVFLFLSDIWEDKRPDWVETARTRPVVEVAALFVRDILPPDIIGNTGAKLREMQQRAQDADAAKQALERLSSPPESSAPQAEPGYNERQRQELDRLIQETQ